MELNMQEAIEYMRSSNEEEYRRTGQPKFYHTVTFGCQMNENDTEKISHLLESMGYLPTDRLEESDAIIFNTCSVREKAELKVYSHLGNLKKLKEERPGLIIAVGGCVAQNKGEEIVKKVKHVDVVFGTHNIHSLPQLFAKVRQSGKKAVEVLDKEGEITDIPTRRQSSFQATVPIMYGCNNFCTYCIVPHVRGRERSRKPEDILKEVTELAQNGCLEVMLLGQNVNSYGKDFTEDFDFADLLLMLDKVEGIGRIRYMTSHPRDFTAKLIKTLKNTRKVCEQFHLPVQAGSNRILKAMNRGYTQEYYLELTGKIKKEFPGCTISTDLIVGFPGETEEDFVETLKVVEEVGYDAAYTFIYSMRTGTPAATMEEQVPVLVKKKRLQRLMDTQNAISLQKNKVLEGTIQEVLVEGRSQNNPDRFTGRTRGNKIVIFDGNDELIGKLVNIKVKEAQTWLLKGEIEGNNG